MANLLAPSRRGQGPKFGDSDAVAAFQAKTLKRPKDRNARRRVDPFHVPTELADGLGVESLPRLQRRVPNKLTKPLQNHADTPRPRENLKTSDLAKRCEANASHWVLRAANWWGGLGGQAGEYSRYAHVCVNQKMGRLGQKSKKIWAKNNYAN
jgi:hypothetical protein